MQVCGVRSSVAASSEHQGHDHDIDHRESGQNIMIMITHIDGEMICMSRRLSISAKHFLNCCFRLACLHVRQRESHARSRNAVHQTRISFETLNRYPFEGRSKA